MDNGIYSIEHLTHEQVRQRIAGRPAVIVPLGGCEPFGGAGAMGAESVCAAAVAGELSKRCRVLAAPLVPFGCSTPFMAFPGSAGVKPRTFVNMLCDILHAYVFQGITRIFLISAAPFNKEPAAEVIKRVEKKYPQVRVMFFDINTILYDGDAKDRYDRDDALLLSLLAHVMPNTPECESPKIRQIGMDKYQTWKKRGKDPEKYRKLFPDGLMLPPDKEISCESGRDYFERIVEKICFELGFQ